MAQKRTDVFAFSTTSTQLCSPSSQLTHARGQANAMSHYASSLSTISLHLFVKLCKQRSADGRFAGQRAHSSRRVLNTLSSHVNRLNAISRASFMSMTGLCLCSIQNCIMNMLGPRGLPNDAQSYAVAQADQTSISAPKLTNLLPFCNSSGAL